MHYPDFVIQGKKQCLSQIGNSPFDAIINYSMGRFRALAFFSAVGIQQRRHLSLVEFGLEAQRGMEVPRIPFMSKDGETETKHASRGNQFVHVVLEKLWL